MSTPIAIPKIAFTMEDLCITTYRERTDDLDRIVHDPYTLLPIHNLTRILPRREVELTNGGIRADSSVSFCGVSKTTLDGNHHSRSFGSSASRKESPKRLNAKTDRLIARPG